MLANASLSGLQAGSLESGVLLGYGMLPNPTYVTKNGAADKDDYREARS